MTRAGWRPAGPPPPLAGIDSLTRYQPLDTDVPALMLGWRQTPILAVLEHTSNFPTDSVLDFWSQKIICV